jgi:hypothetical protein
MTTAAVRQLGDLISVGPAMLRDFEILGIRSVAQLAKQQPREMYERLGRKTGQRQDPCVLDAFSAAVAQARNPRLPAEQCVWWYWSRNRTSAGPAMEMQKTRKARRTSDPRALKPGLAGRSRRKNS